MSAPRCSSDLTVTPDKCLRAGPTRRSFLTWTGVAAGLAFLPGLCGADAVPATPPRVGDGLFTLGVASGDPLPDGVILWTRLAADPLAPGGGMGTAEVPVEWEVATDASMRRVVRQGATVATSATGHAVHVDLRGLQPASDYFYRFRALGDISEVARTRTAPAPGARTGVLTVATVSCQNWADGFHGAYADLASAAPDVVFHLGDYIYEKPIPADGGRRRDTRLPTSALRETTSLADYRERYALYKLDPDLQRAHRSAPFVTMFDDHEVDNNWAAAIGEDETPVPQFLVRRAAAMRAWWENTAVRASRVRHGELRAYRRLAFGDLAEFSILDTRTYRSDQVNGDNDTAQNQHTADPRRTLCGGAQERWLVDGLTTSSRRWNVLAQPLPMADLARDAGGTRAVSMDGWSGYEASRARVLDAVSERGVGNLVSLVGDIHCSVAADLRSNYTGTAPTVGVELAVTSISSGGDGTADGGNLRRLREASPHVRFTDGRRGYLLNRIRRDRWEAEYRVADTVHRPGSPVRRAAVLTVPDSRPELDIV